MHPCLCSSPSSYLFSQPSAPGTEPWKSGNPKQLGLPEEIVELVNAFPFGIRECTYTNDLFVPLIPPFDRAMELTDLYYQHGAWMSVSLSLTSFLRDVLTLVCWYTGTTPSPDRISTPMSSQSFTPPPEQPTYIHTNLPCSSSSW